MFNTDTGNHPLPFRLTGFVRLEAIVGPNGPIPVSKSSWWNKVRTGEFPQPVKIGPRTTAWRVQDILDLINRIENQEK
jgi:prophage regulatory protein